MKKIFLFFIMAASCLFTSCVHKDLCYDHPPHAKKWHLNLQIDYQQEWEQRYGDGINWKENWPDTAGVQYADLIPNIPTGVRVRLYRANGNSEFVNIPAQGDVINVGEGENSLILYNNDTEAILFNDLESFASAQATVNVTDKFIANPEPVSFQFKHLLSKVKITYKNNITNNNYKVSVQGTQLTIKTCAALIETPITDNSKWVPYVNGDRGEFSTSAGIPFSTLWSETVVPNGGSVSTADHRYVIPLENSQDEITFNLTIQKGQDAPVTTRQNIQLNWSPKMGGNYNIVININENSVTQSISNE